MVSRNKQRVLMASLALAIGFSNSAAAQDTDPSVTANLVLQVQELQDEVRMLRGQLEQANTEIENLKRRQRDQYLDLDQRISDLRNSEPVPPSGPRPPHDPRSLRSLPFHRPGPPRPPRTSRRFARR